MVKAANEKKKSRSKNFATPLLPKLMSGEVREAI